MHDGLYSISEVSARTGLQSSALRYYERAGLISADARIGGRRHYDPAILQKLAVIALLQEVGFTISEIARMRASGSDHETWRALAKDKLADIDDPLEKVGSARDLLAAAIACECQGLGRCDLVRSRHGRHRKTLHRIHRRDAAT